MLIKGGDWFVDSASGIARKFHLPELLIGATVVSIGTTLPEVMVSAQGAMAGSGAMAYGNAIGSIICNTSLIAAITIAIKPGKVERRSMIIPITFFFSAAAFYSIISYTTGYFYRWVGIILLAAFVVYMLLTVMSMKKKPSSEIEALDKSEEHTEEESEDEDEGGFSVKAFIIEALVAFAGGAFMIYKGGIIKWIGIALMAMFAIYAAITLVNLARKKAIGSMFRDIFFIVIGLAKLYAILYKKIK
jgi:cation:H+ antiporter